MRYSNQGRFRQQVRFLRRQFLQDGDLPFTNVLSEGIVAQALTAIDVCWLDRIYSPLVTLWVFLGQVLSADHSCRAAVARLIAHRLSRGQRPCSAETGAYCQARKRLPEEFFSDVARQTGVRWKPTSTRSGCGNAAAFTSTTDRRSRCPIRRRTSALIRNPTRRNPAWAFPSHASRPSFLSPAVRFLIWASAATPAKDKASWECCAPCGTSFSPATSCSPIA